MSNKSNWDIQILSLEIINIIQEYVELEGAELCHTCECIWTLPIQIKKCSRPHPYVLLGTTHCTKCKYSYVNSEKFSLRSMMEKEGCFETLKISRERGKGITKWIQCYNCSSFVFDWEIYRRNKNDLVGLIEFENQHVNFIEQVKEKLHYPCGFCKKLMKSRSKNGLICLPCTQFKSESVL